MAFEWLNTNSRKFLSSGYLLEGETAEGRIRQICDTAESILGNEGFSDKMYEYAGKGWISFSSPIWANFGRKRGLPISCFNSHIPDNTPGILFAQSEVGIMSKMGGGTSGYFGDVRPRGSDITDSGKTSGSVHFMELFEKVTDVISQGGVRRGYKAATLPIEHGDIEEFLGIGTEGHPIQTMNTSVSVRDKFMEEMIGGDKNNRGVWGKTLKTRREIGFPYVFFHDNVQRNRPDVYKDKDMEVKSSNLCHEVLLASDDEESFVCDLMSVNMLHVEDWENTDLIETCVYFLDAVMTEFITKLEAFRDSNDKEDQMTFFFLQRAYKFAIRQRALGLGVLGWHSYLQSKFLPFCSDESNALADKYFKLIQERSYNASRELAKMFGEPELLKGYGRRNATLNALAPTTSSAFILGQVSQSIEPLMSNQYIKDLAKTKAVIKNKYLTDLLENKGHNTEEVWESISKNDGSVQHLTFLTEYEKQVFLTFPEIDQKDIIEQAAIRQQYLDQTQSLNLMIPSTMSPKEINHLMIYAWEMGICTLYYQHGTNAAQQFAKNNCVACEA